MSNGDQEHPTRVQREIEAQSMVRLVRDHEGRLQDCEARIVALQAACLPLTRTFWSRLRWLVKGD